MTRVLQMPLKSLQVVGQVERVGKFGLLPVGIDFYGDHIF